MQRGRTKKTLKKTSLNLYCSYYPHRSRKLKAIHMKMLNFVFLDETFTIIYHNYILTYTLLFHVFFKYFLFLFSYKIYRPFGFNTKRTRHVHQTLEQQEFVSSCLHLYFDKLYRLWCYQNQCKSKQCFMINIIYLNNEKLHIPILIKLRELVSQPIWFRGVCTTNILVNYVLTHALSARYLKHSSS